MKNRNEITNVRDIVQLTIENPHADIVKQFRAIVRLIQMSARKGYWHTQYESIDETKRIPYDIENALKFLGFYTNKTGDTKFPDSDGEDS